MQTFKQLCENKLMESKMNVESFKFVKHFMYNEDLIQFLEGITTFVGSIDDYRSENAKGEYSFIPTKYKNEDKFKEDFILAIYNFLKSVDNIDDLKKQLQSRKNIFDTQYEKDLEKAFKGIDTDSLSIFNNIQWKKQSNLFNNLLLQFIQETQGMGDLSL